MNKRRFWAVSSLVSLLVIISVIMSACGATPTSTPTGTATVGGTTITTNAVIEWLRALFRQLLTSPLTTSGASSRTTTPMRRLGIVRMSAFEVSVEPL